MIRSEEWHCVVYELLRMFSLFPSLFSVSHQVSSFRNIFRKLTLHIQCYDELEKASPQEGAPKCDV